MSLLVGSQLMIMKGSEDEEEPDHTKGPEISLHALVGWTTTKTMNLSIMIRKQKVVALIDNNTTHNFISEWVADVGGCGRIE